MLSLGNVIFVYKHQERKEELKAAKGTFQTRRGTQMKIPVAHKEH